MRIENRIGRSLRVDIATEEVTRAKYARLSVEVDLSKRLICKFRLRQRIWRVEYEGFHLVCLKCGKYRHREQLCRLAACEVAGEDDQPQHDPPKSLVQAAKSHRTEQYGAWMLVHDLGGNQGILISPMIHRMEGKRISR